MDFRAIIAEQRGELEEMLGQGIVVEREAAGVAAKFLRGPNILAVIGVRRCGKSVFSYLLARGAKFGYINFDDERLSGASAQDLNAVLQSFYELYGDVEFVVLDEVQNVRGWELFASRLRRTKKVIVTGSSSKLLSGELSTRLTGRHSDVVLYPFSFREFLALKGVAGGGLTTRDKAAALNLLREYLSIGGFPEVQKFGKQMAQTIYNDVIVNDVVLRYNVRKRRELMALSHRLVSDFSCEITYRSLARALGVRHVSTVSNWVSYIEEAFLVIRLERFSYKLKEQFIAPKKIYCIDNGIATSMGFSTSENIGKLMENAVAVELQRRKQNAMDEIYYWKDHSHREVDFMVKRGPAVQQLIQVTYATTREGIRERELECLVVAGREVRCRDLLLITWDYEGEARYKNKRIKCLPLLKWLTGKLAVGKSAM